MGGVLGQRSFKEEAGEDGETGEERGQDASFEEEELGLDAVDIGRGLEGGDEVLGEGGGG